MKNRKGISLLEIVVATLILSITMAGLVNVFISGKRWLLHSRMRMSSGELGRYFLDPLYSSVKQSEFSGADYTAPNPLRQRNNEVESSVSLDGRQYSPSYTVTTIPANPGSQMRKVKLTVSWPEPAN